MPQVGDTISRERALLLPASPASVADLCDRLNRLYHSGYARKRYIDKRKRVS